MAWTGIGGGPWKLLMGWDFFNGLARDARWRLGCFILFYGFYGVLVSG